MKIIGTNRRTYPSEMMREAILESRREWPEAARHLEEACTVTVVLVAGGVDDYAAYAGIGSPEWIARFGNKLRFEEACVHFPGGLDRERYRE